MMRARAGFTLVEGFEPLALRTAEAAGLDATTALDAENPDATLQVEGVLSRLPAPSGRA